jgi:hypothetical protein
VLPDRTDTQYYMQIVSEENMSSNSPSEPNNQPGAND